ncbi:hypothetical protein J2S74_005401 [Evansella vedderi]|uniref:Uncharacterized protein n=1 Tax=Evansella vedderi TaxID=38282 RepID=A0ABU0A373_9BACI|nr:hypothetical protein [Evansella vedderi]MDQ0257938.1 hypothetical protein [Evansella vedderi]
MSLVIGIAFKDFVIVSNDSKVTIQHYYADTLEKDKSKPIIETNLKSEKVTRITDKVFLAVTGFQNVTELIKQELVQRVNKDNDLQECSKIAEQVITEIKGRELEGLDIPEQDAIRMIREGFSAYLFGFTHSGNAGLKDICYGGYAESRDITKAYPTVINGPDPEYDFKFREVLSLRKDERFFQNFINRILVVHAYLSHKHHTSVSTDCNFHILYKDGDLIKYSKQTIDSANYYEQFGLKTLQKEVESDDF